MFIKSLVSATLTCAAAAGFILAAPASALAFTEAAPPPYVAYQVRSGEGFVRMRAIPVQRGSDRRYFEFKKVESILVPGTGPGGEESTALPLLSFKLKEGKRCTDDGTFCAKKHECSQGGVCEKAPRYARETFDVQDANGSFSVVTIKPDHVLVPANVSVDDVAARPDADDYPMDHYTCFKAKAQGLPRGLSVDLGTLFDPDPRVLALKRFSRLCLPSEVRGSTVHRSRAGLACYIAKPDRGQPRHVPTAELSVHEQLLQFTASTRKERRVCLPATVGAEVVPWSIDVTVDGQVGDWTAGTSFATGGGMNRIGWDAENIYVASSQPEFAGSGEGLRVVAYLGDGESGLFQTPVVGSHAAHLPRPMVLAAVYDLQSGSLSFLSASPAGGWQEISGKSGGSAVWNPSAAAVEMAIPRSLLTAWPNLYMHVSSYDTRLGSERSFGATPPGAEIPVEMGANAFIPDVVAFGTEEDVPPISNGKVQRWNQPPPWVAQLNRSTQDSLRIATFNVGHLDMPLDPLAFPGGVALQLHISATVPWIAVASAALCVIGGPAAALVCGIAAQAVGVHVLNAVLEDIDNGFETNLGWESNEARAAEIAKQLLKADLDVLVLNEVFDGDAIEEYVKALGGKYPHRIERIHPEPETDAGKFVEGVGQGHFGAFGVQSSGLMVFSRHPFAALQGLGGPGVPTNTTTYFDIAENNSVQTNVIVGTPGPGEKLAFRRFEFLSECRGEDCLAGKGVGAVQVVKNGKTKTIVFSHMQATYGAEEGGDFNVRRKQIDQIRTLIGDISAPNRDVYVLGDLNIIGRHPDGPPAHDAIDLLATADQIYDQGRQEWLHHFCGLKSDENGQQLSCACSAANSCDGFGFLANPSPFFACGGHPAASCVADGSAFRDLWAYETSVFDLGQTNPAGSLLNRMQGAGPCIKGTEKDPNAEDDPNFKLGCYGYRLDYILHGLPEHVEPDDEVCVQHMRRMYDWVQPPGHPIASDHLPVLADLNGWNNYCSPLEAGKVELTLDSTAQSVDYVPLEATEILFPGSMQWFEITNEGSYSIDAQAPGSTLVDVAFEVYHPTDLSLPISSFHNKTTDWGIRYHFPDPPYLVRVFAVDGAGRADRTTQGLYALTIHRHACTSADDACSLMAGGSTQAWWPDYKGFTSWSDSADHSCQGSIDPNCTEPDALWFLFKTYRDDRGELPQIVFPASGSCMTGLEDELRPLSLEVVEEDATNGVHDRVMVPVGSVGSALEFDATCLPSHCLLTDNCSCSPSSSCQEQLSCTTTRLEAPPQDLLTPLAHNTTPDLVDPLVRKSEDYFLRVLRPDPWTGDNSPATAGCQYDPPQPPQGGFCQSENIDCGSPSNTRRVEVSFETDMTFLFPISIKIFNPEDPFSPYDEVFHRFEVNGSGSIDSFVHPKSLGPDYQGWKLFHPAMKIKANHPFKVGPFGYSGNLSYKVVEDGWPSPENDPDTIGVRTGLGLEDDYFRTLEPSLLSDTGARTSNMASPGAESTGGPGHWYATYTCRRHELPDPDEDCMKKGRGVSCCTEPSHLEPPGP